MPRNKSNLIRIAILALGFSILYGCGNFSLDNPNHYSGSLFRRAYVNDSAANDSLPGDLVDRGIRFVLQPSKTYQLSIRTARSQDQLALYYYNDGISGTYTTLSGRSDGSQETFTLNSNKPAAQFFAAQLLVPDGISAVKGLGHVALRSTAPISSDTINVRLLFIRKLSGLPDSTAKAAFASSLFSAMAAVYAPFKIVLKGSFDIVEPTAAAVNFPFNSYFVSLPGKRVANNVHLYLVDSISVADTASGLVGEVLGFAPREVVDLDMDRESRIILSNQASVSRMAVTATHEMGHFFGLRHTVSTQHDLLQDKDGSNVEDGFPDTKFCNLGQLAKRAASSSWDRSTSNVYCLRMAYGSCDSAGCDLSNLMHPEECPEVKQTQLSLMQIDFLKKNLAAYRHP